MAMKGAAFLVAFSLVYFGVIVNCFTSGNQFNPLQNLFSPDRIRSSKKNADSQQFKELPREYYSPVYTGPQAGLRESDKITSLPGQPAVDFDQYAGYVTISPTPGKALFYYFVESEENSSTKPLVLWQNGGPSCSALGFGAMMELGPFRVNPDNKTLWKNQYAWNKVANILFIEAPAGVGFSYSNKTSDYITGDEQHAADTYTFLINWLERFPEYKTRDFYLAGESYSGHYVPQLAQLILHNNNITNQTVINLRGISIGNAYMDYETHHTGRYDYQWTHALISDELHENIVSICNFSSKEAFSEVCEEILAQVQSATGNIYEFNIYAPLCNLSHSPPKHGFDPCTDKYISGYLNIPEVQKSLHANVTGIPKPWESCNLYMNVKWLEEAETVLPTIKEVMSSGIRVWLYSGDTDGQVPITTTRYGIDKLKLPVKTPWAAWYNEGEVGGYVVEYENLTFATVREAGHFVPSYQPARALALFSSFINGKLPSQFPN